MINLFSKRFYYLQNFNHQQKIKKSLNQSNKQFKPNKQLNLMNNSQYASQPLKNIQNSFEIDQINNPETVQVFLKSTESKSIKLKISKKLNLQNLKQIIQQKLFILFDDQQIYLNGKNITFFNSITLQNKEILHIINKKCITNENDPINIKVVIDSPSNIQLHDKIFNIQMSASDKLISLKNFLIGLTELQNQIHQFQTYFLESGRLLDINGTFISNKIPKKCQIFFIISQNQVQTKFTNQYEENENSMSYFEDQKIKNPLQDNFYQESKPQNKPAKVPKKASHLLPSQVFKFGKQKQAKKSSNSRRKTQQPASSELNGFKKKKAYYQEFSQNNSQLIKKIVVHKSIQEIQKLASENSLIQASISNQEIEIDSPEQKSNEKPFKAVLQQKQIRPCPSIPQRKMNVSQKVKINKELQRLFDGLDSNRTNPVPVNKEENEQETNLKNNIRQRLTVNNQFLRNSIGSKHSVGRIFQQKRSKRYTDVNIDNQQ